MEGTRSVCTGQCCAAFPLSANRDYVQSRGDDSGEYALIGSLLFELTRDEAYARLEALSLNPPAWWAEQAERQLYSCRHWDTRSRLCTIYERRPLMCSRYPYSAACEHCGYRHPDLYKEPEPAGAA